MQPKDDQGKACFLLPTYNFVQLALWLWLCISAIGLFAQKNPQPYFRNYSTEQGLPSSETYFVTQDSKGYMWFGTDNGAARFDGYTFTTYGAKQGLASNVVFDIYEDAKGRMWFGTMTGEAFILEGDTIKPYRYNHLVEKYRGQFTVAGLVYLGEQETVYFELERLGFLKIDKYGNDELITTEKAKGALILEIEGYARGLRTPVEKRIQEAQSSVLWNYEKDNNVLLLESVSPSGRIQMELPYYSKPSCKLEFKAQRIPESKWLVSSCNHLFCLEEQKILWSIPFDFSFNETYQANDQSIWICGRTGRGLRRYKNLEALSRNQYEQYLSGLSISSFYEDTDGGIWISTLEKGIFYCSNLELLIYDERFGLSDHLITAIAFKNEQTLFAGFKNGDIFEIDLKNNSVNDYFKRERGANNYELFFHKTKNVLWSSFGYWKNKKWHYPSGRHFITGKKYSSTINKLVKLHLNDTQDLIGCNNNGIYIIDISADTILVDPFAFNIRERTYAVHTDQQNRLWTGNARGLFEFKDSSLISPNIDHPAFRSRVEDIDGFPDGSLVFGTKGWGVIRWQGEEVIQITTDEGLTSNMIEEVHVDENGILWVGTLNGLNKVSFDGERKPKVRQYSMANGLPSNEITKIRSMNGRVWMCTPKGLVKLHEPEEELITTPPNIVAIQVNGTSIVHAQAANFKYGENNMAFEFLTINYQQNGRIPYRYRIDSNAPWQYTQGLIANYPKLSQGDYRFEVQSQNQDGHWSSSAVYEFQIYPPWWNSWWARLIVICLVGFGLYAYQRAQNQKLLKEAAIQQQITDLERSALQAQMNPHFIFNCLNSIQNFILQNDRKQAVEYLSRFAQLVRHNLNASVQGEVSLEEELSLLDNYLALEQERFEHRFSYQLEVAPELDDASITFPPLLIQPYVENAIAHGLSKKQEAGKVDVHFSRENGHLAVLIRDNGPGFQIGQAKSQKNRHKSVGMTITQKRLELLGNAEEELVRIASLQEKEGASGTEVKILIELNKGR